MWFRHLSWCYAENSAGQWAIHQSFASDFGYEFVNVRNGNTTANIIRLSLEECVYVEINEYWSQELERDNIWSIVFKHKPQQNSLHVSFLWHNPVTRQRKFQQAMIEKNCLRALMRRRSWVLASYTSITLSLHAFHSRNLCFHCNERKNSSVVFPASKC